MGLGAALKRRYSRGGIPPGIRQIHLQCVITPDTLMRDEEDLLNVKSISHAEQSGEPEPPITRVLKSSFISGGPVTAVVRRQKS